MMPPCIVYWKGVYGQCRVGGEVWSEVTAAMAEMVFELWAMTTTNSKSTEAPNAPVFPSDFPQT